MSRKLFGTDGIRGKANVFPITPEVALSLGKAITKVLRRDDNPKPRIVIGKDTRISCYMLELSISSGVVSMGGEVLLTGPIPTPAIAFLTPNMRCDAGVVVSASHNPFHDNGIKFFNSHGFKLDDDVELEIEKLVLQGGGIDGVTPEEIGKVRRINDALGRYVVFLKSSLPKEMKFGGIKIGLDCANGATYRVAPELFYELGAQVSAVGIEPDGFNINKDCGALFPENIAAFVKDRGLHIGLSFDGDGDRVVMVDEKGRVIDGDKIIAFLAVSLKKRGELKGNKAVCTVMSNMAMEEFLKAHGVNVIRSRVGDRYVLEAMIKEGAILGGEQSGHVIMLSHSTTGDGLLTALQVLRFLVEDEKEPSYVYDLFEPYPQEKRSVRVRERKDLKSVPDILKVKEKLEKELGPFGRILVRYSGTEPVLRIMVEGKDSEKIKRTADDMVEVARRCLS